MKLDDCLVIGGGVVGLSIAYELSGRGMRVRVVDQNAMGREASWAGAGILPAAVVDPDHPIYDALCQLSFNLHAAWSQRLVDQTGIDTGYRPCSELSFARTEDQHSSLDAEVAALRRRGIEVNELAVDQLLQLEPALSGLNEGNLKACYQIPAAAQLRNPRHLKALVAGCRQQGVQFSENTKVQSIDAQSGRIQRLQTSSGTLQADRYCFAAGAWSGDLLSQLGCRLPIKPIRGQIALLKLPETRLQSVVYEKRRYMVPRDDGRLLVGSTLEDVGFDKRTTVSAITDLLSFATSVMPELATVEVEKCWAGLRPCTPDRMPYLGRLPNMDNAFVAAGHFRWGLYLSPATAVLMSELMRDERPQIDLQTFRLERSTTN